MVAHGHYKVNVMPFELKNAPLEFQHIMDKVYKPISDFCLIYIIDAIIFSINEEEHIKHLLKFKELTYKHGLALSESKMKIGLEEIIFLALHIKDEHIILQSHIAKKIS